MKKIIKQTIVENFFFFIPFFLWVIIGGILLIIKSRAELFFPINYGHTPFKNILFNVFSAYGQGDIIAILLLSLLLLPAFRNKQYILSSLIYGLFIPTIIFITKLYFDKPRPISFYGMRKVETVIWLDNYLNNSFPSGHTLGAFGFFMLWSLFLPKKHKPFSLIFFTIALFVGFSRIYLGQHFFQDIYAGSVAGTLLSVTIYVLVSYFIPKYKTI